MGGLRGRGLGSSLGLLAMETSADPAGGYSGPTQEFKIPASFWGWSLGFTLPQASLRAQNQAVSLLVPPLPWA